MTSISNGVLLNPAASAKMLKRPKLTMNMLLRPNGSAMRAKNIRKLPAASELEAVIQVISALGMCTSAPMRAIITVTMPMVNEETPKAIVQVSTKRASEIAPWKHDERFLGSYVSVATVEIGVEVLEWVQLEGIPCSFAWADDP